VIVSTTPVILTHFDGLTDPRMERVRPPHPILTAQIASRVDLVHPVSKEAGYGTAGGSAEVFGVAATAEAV
jgi:hypothetical protein